MQSPARNSSLTRMVSGIASGIGGLLKRSNSRGPGSVTSGRGNKRNSKPDSTQASSAAYGATDGSAKKLKLPEKMPTLKKITGPGSVRSGSGPGSIAGSNMSDIERMERLMNVTKYAKKSIVKIFGKHFEEFRREMQQSNMIINSNLLS